MKRVLDAWVLMIKKYHSTMLQWGKWDAKAQDLLSSVLY